MKKRKKGVLTPYLYIAPSFLIYFIFIIIPVISAVIFSFTNYKLNNLKFVGINNYLRLFRDGIFQKSLVNTLVYSFFVVGINLVLGLVIAAVLSEGWFRLGKFCRTVFYVPYIISAIAASMIWLYMYDSTDGVLNNVMKMCGLRGQSWLLNERLAMPSLIFMGVWQGMGYCMVVYFSAIKGIPRYLYEAAELDGATKIQQFFKISVPMLSSTTFFLLVMTMISSFQVFAQIVTMTDGGPLNSTTTIAHQVYLNAFQKNYMGYATSQAVTLFLIVLVITVLFFRYGNKEGDAELD